MYSTNKSHHYNHYLLHHNLTYLMHQLFVTTAPPPTGNSGDNDFSSITALLKALYCGDLLRVIALLFIRVNSTGYIYVISQARHLPGTAGELKRSLPCTLTPLSPVHPHRWGGRGYKWLVHKMVSKAERICNNAQYDQISTINHVFARFSSDI